MSGYALQNVNMNHNNHSIAFKQKAGKAAVLLYLTITKPPAYKNATVKNVWMALYPTSFKKLALAFALSLKCRSINVSWIVE